MRCVEENEAVRMSCCGKGKKKGGGGEREERTRKGGKKAGREEIRLVAYLFVSGGLEVLLELGVVAHVLQHDGTDLG